MLLTDSQRRYHLQLAALDRLLNIYADAALEAYDNDDEFNRLVRYNSAIFAAIERRVWGS